jgi:hypothetical protein
LVFLVVYFFLPSPPKSYMHFSSTHQCYMPCPSHHPWLYSAKGVRYGAPHYAVSSNLLLSHSSSAQIFSSAFFSQMPFFIILVCEAIGTAATLGLLCRPRVIVKMIVEKQMECWLTGETEVLGENLPQHHFCPSQNPTWPDPGLNPGRRSGKPATNRLSYGAAISNTFDQCSSFNARDQVSVRNYRQNYCFLYFDFYVFRRHTRRQEFLD